MNGVLNQPASQRENQDLTKIAKDAEAQVPKELQGQFLSIMVAGGKLMWSKEMSTERQAFDQALQENGNIPQVVAHTVIKICSIIQNESGSKKPLDAIGIAAPIFMAHVLQYVEAKQGTQITREMIGQTAQLIQMNLMKAYGITEQQVQELIKQRSQGQHPSQQTAQSDTEGNPEEAAEGTPGVTDSTEEETEEEA